MVQSKNFAKEKGIGIYMVMQVAVRERYLKSMGVLMFPLVSLREKLFQSIVLSLDIKCRYFSTMTEKSSPSNRDGQVSTRWQLYK